MLVSYVLRLHVTELAAGRLVGVIEDVRSGEHTTIGDADELMAFCASHVDRAPAEKGGS